MASISTDTSGSYQDSMLSNTSLSPWTFLRAAVSFLASLRVTVVLFALSIILILIGTLAQAKMDMWEVMERYFQSWIAWVDFQVFFPPAWFPNLQNVPGGIWFPGGAAIGLGLLINLIAAHAVRFKLQARGARLAAGLGVLTLGILLTTLVVVSGHDHSGLQAEPPFAWSTLWLLVKLGLAATALGAIAGGTLMPRREGSRGVERMLLWAVGTVFGLLAAYLFVAGQNAYIGDPGMRILWQLIKGGLAGLVMLAGCLLLHKKRGGVVLVHLGVGLMMFGQFWVASYDVEEQITVAEGQTVSYARDIRQTELAIVHPKSEEQDEVVAVPQSTLVASAAGGRQSWFGGSPDVDANGVIQHEYLPFEIQVLKYYKNAVLQEAQSDDDNLATAGLGRSMVARPARASTGASMSDGVDLAAAYVEFLKPDGASLGVYLLSQIAAEQDMTEQIRLDGKTYDVSLRFRRNYKPYSVTLLDVSKDDYLGTDTPRNYSSDIHLVDPERGTDRKVHIWMNNPLRYAGETFYQSGYAGPPDVRTERTTLAVVTNAGWLIPYVACVWVGIGLLAHFNGSLLRFLNRKMGQQGKSPEDPKKLSGEAQDAPLWRHPDVHTVLLPILFVGLFGWVLASHASNSQVVVNRMQLDKFGSLPVIADGRVKPFDTLARNTLRVISNRVTFHARLHPATLQKQWPEISKKIAGHWSEVSVDDVKQHEGDVGAVIDLVEEKTGENRYRIEEYVDKLTTERSPAIRWLLDVIADPETAEQHKVFRIDHLDVLGTLGLERRKSHLYSVAEIRGGVEEFEKQVDQARQLDTEDLSKYQRKILDLDRRIRRYTRLGAAFQPPMLPSLPTQEELENDRSAAMEKLSRFQRAFMSFRQNIKSIKPPLAIPVEDEEGEETWESYAAAWARAFVNAQLLGKDPSPTMLHFNSILVAYQRGDADTFNAEAAKYHRLLERDPPEQLQTEPTMMGRFVERKFGSFFAFEAFFNHVSPFFFCWFPYLTAFALAALAWLGWSKPLNWTAFWLIAFTFIIHSIALAARMYISGRPPVTNLYSSAVFIGWGAVLFGLVLEFIYRNGLGNVVSSVLGFSSLIVAYNLAGDGDTFTVLQAVLDTQFWLATHVVTITMGYATTFLAGFLGIFYILQGWLSKTLKPERSKELARMIYGILCFSLFFSFIGTVLGGLWADDSWGRFWGWDPKENGALIIVLWNALVLHARWGGMVKERGLAVLAVGGNIVTAWSWFGVNELGVGLHSYGFTEGVLLALGLFVLSQLALITVGMLPKRLWPSFRT